MICNDGDDHEGHLDEAILQHHRHTDAKQLAQHILLRFEVCTRHADAVPLPNDQQRHYHADQLGKGRAQGCTGRAEMQCAHKEVVQRDVAHAGDRNEIHRAFGIAQPAKNRRQNVISRDAWDADKADDEVRFAPATASSGTDTSRMMGSTKPTSTAASTTDPVRNRVTVLPMSFAAWERFPHRRPARW